MFSSIGLRDKPLQCVYKQSAKEEIRKIRKNSSYPLNDSGIFTGLYEVAQPLQENHRCKAFKVSIEKTPASLSVDGNITDSCVLETGDIGLSFLFDWVAVFEK